MPKLFTTRLLVLLTLGLALSACGFRLAGTASLPAELNHIYLVTSDFSKQQRDTLRRQLVRAGAQVYDEANAQAVQLNVRLKVSPDRRLVTGADNGKNIERMTRSLDFSLKDNAGKQLVPGKSLTQQKDFVLDDDNLLSSAVERRNVIEDLELALFNRLIHQLKRI